MFIIFYENKNYPIILRMSKHCRKRMRERNLTKIIKEINGRSIKYTKLLYKKRIFYKLIDYNLIFVCEDTKILTLFVNKTYDKVIMNKLFNEFN